MDHKAAAQIMASHGNEVVEMIEETQLGMDLEVPAMYKEETWEQFCHRLLCLAFEGWCVRLQPIQDQMT